MSYFKERNEFYEPSYTTQIDSPDVHFEHTLFLYLNYFMIPGH